MRLTKAGEGHLRTGCQEPCERVTMTMILWTGPSRDCPQAKMKSTNQYWMSPIMRRVMTLNSMLPMAKRRKSEQAALLGKSSSSKLPARTGRTGVNRRVQGRLQNMLSLPLDVLFLIFSRLGPMDLVNLSRTSKALRRLLMSRKSMWVWIAARRNTGVTGAPDPPEDMSEPAWALLLFGPAVCSQCSTRNIHRVDFALRRRLCTVCRRRNLVFSIKFQSQCPGLKESVMDLLPYTKIGGWAHGHPSNSRFYWRPDLYEMGKRLAELEEDRDAGKPGALQKLKAFRAERILFVDSIVQSCAEFERWVSAEAEAQTRDAFERIFQRHEALKDRILAAGYDIADINFIGIGAVPSANVNKVLTEEGWRRIRTKVETRLSSAREARLRAERRQRENDHRIQAEQCYSGILRQVLPVQRLYLPALSQAHELSCFRELLDPDRDMQPDQWELASGRLAESLSEWMTEHKDRYTSLLPPQVYGAQGTAMEIRLLSDPSIDLWRHGAMGDFAGRLDLATSVFRHPTTDTILIGRDSCHAWKMAGELEFCERGAEAVHALLQVLELDPATTTAVMVDQLGRHFVCAGCPLHLERNDLSWRCCVSHFVESSETDHPYPQWLAADFDEAAMDDDPFAPQTWYGRQPETWLCNHCSDYLAPSLTVPFGQYLRVGSREDAFSMCRQDTVRHNIDDPVVDVDLFSFPMFSVDRY
ncbi:hypothetical protein BJV74DRAFT_868159 [Russula compacta]|nr:hypothetical protein BJV74DRAFT_868159 [Russula compacta]